MLDHNIILDKIKALTVINVLEPVTMTNLKKVFKNTINPDSLSIILTELLDEKLVAIEKMHYRVTLKGLSFKMSRESRTLRDIYRMKYILNTKKAKGR